MVSGDSPSPYPPNNIRINEVSEGYPMGYNPNFRIIYLRYFSVDFSDVLKMVFWKGEGGGEGKGEGWF